MDGTHIASSISADFNFEHIFANVPAGEYKILVDHVCCDQASELNFALAWWYGEAPPLQSPGDFNGDGRVDAADYVVWRKTGGSSEEYDEWRANFGVTAGSGSSLESLALVPEPSSLILLIGCFLLGGGRIRVA